MKTTSEVRHNIRHNASEIIKLIKKMRKLYNSFLIFVLEAAVTEGSFELAAEASSFLGSQWASVITDLISDIEELETLRQAAVTASGIVNEENNRLRSENEALRAALRQAKIALYHEVPSGCWATGPMTGDMITDLVECPGCKVIAAADALLIPEKGE